jgi:hypothetical protein
MHLRSKGKDIPEGRSNKKSSQKECIHESKTVPLMPLHYSTEIESRGRKFKAGRML